MTRIVYQAFNKVTGMSYVGATTVGLEERRKEHYSKTSKRDNNKFIKAFMKQINDVILTPEQVKLVQDDKELQEAYTKVMTAFNNSIPTIKQIEPTKFVAHYGEDYNNAISNYYQLIINKLETLNV